MTMQDIGEVGPWGDVFQACDDADIRKAEQRAEQERDDRRYLALNVYRTSRRQRGRRR
jgi:hypothetical protein